MACVQAVFEVANGLKEHIMHKLLTLEVEVTSWVDYLTVFPQDVLDW